MKVQIYIGCNMVSTASPGEMENRGVAVDETQMGSQRVTPEYRRMKSYAIAHIVVEVLEIILGIASFLLVSSVFRGGPD